MVLSYDQKQSKVLCPPSVLWVHKVAWFEYFGQLLIKNLHTKITLREQCLTIEQGLFDFFSAKIWYFDQIISIKSLLTSGKEDQAWKL